jgi:hypothetical protein
LLVVVNKECTWNDWINTKPHCGRVTSLRFA